MFTQQDSTEYYRALDELCQGYSSKQLALALIEAGVCNPSTSLESVMSHVRAARNVNRADYFKISELIALTRHSNRLSIVSYFNRMVGCKQPERAQPPESESIMKLHRKQQVLTEELHFVTNRLSQLRDEKQKPQERVLFVSEG